VPPLALLRHLLSFPTRRSSDLDSLIAGAVPGAPSGSSLVLDGVRWSWLGCLQRCNDADPPAPGSAPLTDAVERLLLDASPRHPRSEEHTSELQSRFDLVCRLLL